MNKVEKRSFLLINLLISIIGIVYFVYKYFLSQQTDYGIRPHASTSFWLHLHIASVPALLIAIGYLFSVHVGPKLKAAKPNRSISGIFLIKSFIVMVISGYALQMGLSQDFNELSGYIHSAISFIWIVLLIWHIRFKIN